MKSLHQFLRIQRSEELVIWLRKSKKKKKKLEESLDEVVVETDLEDEGTPSPFRTKDMGFESS